MSPPRRREGGPLADTGDDDTVRRAKGGDPEAWRTLHAAHAARLVAWLRLRPTGDSALTADDIAADTWLVAATRIADFHGDADEFAGWLFGIARKTAYRAYEKSQRRRTSPSAFGADGGVPLDDLLAPEPDATPGVDGQDLVLRLLATLPPRERDAVGLVDGLGLDPKHAARALGVSAVALRVARHRGLRRLRDAPILAQVTERV